MRKILPYCMCLSLFFTQPALAQAVAYCVHGKAKITDCTLSSDNGYLSIEYRSKKLAPQYNRRILGKKITKLTGGEYARRRVAESVTLGVLITPWALFGLFSKKERDTFGIEFINEQGNGDATIVLAKKKYSMGVKTLLQAVSGKAVEYENRGEKKLKIDF